MRDQDIRVALLAHLRHLHAADPETLIVEEVPICHGRSRVDLAVVNGRLHGYEIKSQLDTLSRLPSQLRDYGCVFDEVTLVIGLKHITGVLGGLPSWCGIILANWVDGVVMLEPFREGGQNLHRDPFSLAQLLWKDEAMEILERHGFAKGVRGRPRLALWQRLSESLSLHDLALEVRETLKARKLEWRRVSVAGEVRPVRPARRGRRRRKTRVRRAAAS